MILYLPMQRSVLELVLEWKGVGFQHRAVLEWIGQHYQWDLMQ